MDGSAGASTSFGRIVPVYLADQVSRARSGFDAAMFADVKAGRVPPAQLPNIINATHQVAWTVFRFGPSFGKPFPDEQFPVEAHRRALQADDSRPQRDAADAESHVDEHGRAGRPPARRRPDGTLGIRLFPEQAALIDPTGIKGLISIEMPCPTLTAAQIATIAKIPTLVMFGDHLGDIQGGGPANWAASFDSCNAFVAQVNKAGGDAQMMHLPALGIHGNSHMLMQDKNSDQLADLVLAWIDKHVEAKKTLAPK